MPTRTEEGITIPIQLFQILISGYDCSFQTHSKRIVERIQILAKSSRKDGNIALLQKIMQEEADLLKCLIEHKNA